MKKLLLSLLLIGSFANAWEESDLENSVFKVAVADPNGEFKFVATSFAVKYKGNRYFVTNNHVCNLFPKHNAFLLKSNKYVDVKPETPSYAVADIYMHPGSDICIMRVMADKGVNYLTMSGDNLKPGELGIVAGFIGKYYSLMSESGTVVGDMKTQYAGEKKACASLEAVDKSAKLYHGLTCAVYKDTFEIAEVDETVLISQVSFGYSGSAVLNKNKEVSGVVVKMLAPNEDYSRSNAVIIKEKDIEDALKKAVFVDYKTEETALYIKNIIFSQKNIDFSLQMESVYKSYLENVIKAEIENH